MRVSLIYSFFCIISCVCFLFTVLPCRHLVRGHTCTCRFRRLDYIAARTNPAVANTPAKRNMKRLLEWCGGKEAP